MDISISAVLSNSVQVRKVKIGGCGIWTQLLNSHSYVLCILPWSLFSLYYHWFLFSADISVTHLSIISHSKIKNFPNGTVFLSYKLSWISGLSYRIPCVGSLLSSWLWKKTLYLAVLDVPIDDQVASLGCGRTQQECTVKENHCFTQEGQGKMWCLWWSEAIPFVPYTGGSTTSQWSQNGDHTVTMSPLERF